MKLNKTIAPLVTRAIVFVAAFVVVSGIFGPRIIGGDILLVDGFEIYGTAGKILLFGVIALSILVYRKHAQLSLTKWSISQLYWAGLALVALGISWVSIGNLLHNHQQLINILLAHIGLLFGVIFMLIASFGAVNLTKIGLVFKRELYISALIGAVFYIFLIAVYALWSPLATSVLGGVKLLLGVAGPRTTIIPPNTLMFDKFGITVAQYCSGVESIALFSGLYAVIGLLDWHRLNKARFVSVFWLALGLLFVMNIFRVYILIVAGYYINPAIAFSLFHTYAGTVFFILYSAVFWMIAYKHLLKPTEDTYENSTVS